MKKVKINSLSKANRENAQLLQGMVLRMIYHLILTMKSSPIHLRGRKEIIGNFLWRCLMDSALSLTMAAYSISRVIPCTQTDPQPTSFPQAQILSTLVRWASCKNQTTKCGLGIFGR
jgi:hypothetical protein